MDLNKHNDRTFLKQIDCRRLISDLTADCIGSLLIGISVVVFALGGNFAPGGINGMAVIINRLTQLPIGNAVLFLNVPLILLCFRLLGKGFFLRSVKTIIINAFILDYATFLFPAFTGNRLMAALLAGLFAGAGFALIYMRNSSTGGSDFLIMSVRKLKPALSIGAITRVIDGSVILAAGFVFRQVDTVFLGIIYTIVTSFTIDLVMKYGPSGKVGLA